MNRTADPRSIHFRSKTLRRVFLAAVEQGWDWRIGGDHIVVYPVDKTQPQMILSGTAYDGSAMKHVISRFKRAGLRL